MAKALYEDHYSPPRAAILHMPQHIGEQVEFTPWEDERPDWQEKWREKADRILGVLGARGSVEPQQEKEIAMNVIPVANMGSLYALEPGEPWWMVQHNDNSDHGRGQHYFETEGAAWAYAGEIETNPPAGNDRHPAPASLDVRVFRVERLR